MPRTRSCRTSRTFCIGLIVLNGYAAVAYLPRPSRSLLHSRAIPFLGRCRQFGHLPRTAHTIRLAAARRTQPQTAATLAILEFESQLFLAAVPPGLRFHGSS